MDLQALRQQVLFPQVRVTTHQGGGSGTIIYSKAGSTYVLTCHHVIASALSVKQEWSPKLGREVKREFRQAVTIEFFDWDNVPHGHRPVNSSVDGDIVAYDQDHDMAIVKLRTNKTVEAVANMPVPGADKALSIGSPVVAAGAALLHDPVITVGIITHMGDEIDFKDYWMSNAQIIFGNSGGAVFNHKDDKYEFLGIPSRIAVHGWGTPITHLGYFSPIHRVYEFFNEQLYHFLIPNSACTETKCEQERKVLKEREERKAMVFGLADTVGGANDE